MLPLLVEGTVRPGMGPPGRGPLRPPRPACSPGKLRANREVPVQTEDSGTKRLRLSAEVGRARAPARGRWQGCPQTSLACIVAQTALPWLPPFRHCRGCLQEPCQSRPPRSSPQTATASPT